MTDVVVMPDAGDGADAMVPFEGVWRSQRAYTGAGFMGWEITEPPVKTMAFAVAGRPALVFTAENGAPTKAEFAPDVDADAAARHFIDLVNEQFARCGRP